MISLEARTPRLQHAPSAMWGEGGGPCGSLPSLEAPGMQLGRRTSLPPLWVGHPSVC